MESWEREYHVSRIVSGTLPFKKYTIGQPSRLNRFVANEIYQRAWKEAHLQSILTNEELYSFLVLRGIWTTEMEDEHKLLTEKIDDMKVGLYENWSQSTARFQIRHALNIGKAELLRLDGVRHGLDHITCEGIAASARIRFIVGTSIFRRDGSPYWDEPLVEWESPDDTVEAAIEHIYRHRLNESETRELCRTEPWRSIWSARTHAGAGLFGVASVDLTDEQRTLMLWSTIYESIKEHSEVPSDDVIEDDDMMDGWLISQRRRREAMMTQKKADEIGNERIRKADEVFVPADAEGAKKVEAMNDMNAKNIKAQRMALLKQRGRVPEIHMPDTRQRFDMEMARLESQKIRGG